MNGYKSWKNTFRDENRTFKDFAVKISFVLLYWTCQGYNLKKNIYYIGGTHDEYNGETIWSNS